ncbi:hypothetical protein DUI87_22266 [Hirundo rustica rustica]|uniref:ribonuclease H n=1 Tax=Hirundo rustica rustica TaxID=333673 RepID=A0A3M0JKF2_HIRRU|nr:hypothetical protein DUI87_22266 [Hirundo rustica rustica]
MNSTEFQLWESAWRRLLTDALPGLLVDPETAVDEEGNAPDLLMGEGRWTAPVDQATTILPKALQTIRDHAITDFFGMAPDGPVIPYSKILQEPKESFTAFVERLTRAIELQVPDVTARRGILREMAFTNANSVSRTAILSLPLDPPPTISDMLRVCQIKVPLIQAGETEQRANTPKVAAINTQPSTGPTPQRETVHPEPNRVDQKKGEEVEKQRANDMLPIPAKDKDKTLPDITTLTDHDISKPILTTDSRYTPYRLQLTEGLHLRTADWTLASVNTEEQDPWPINEAVTEECPTQKLNWLTDSPVWVEQWPLSKEKLKALEELVEEQLAKGHIVETNSPWNSPVFVIKKPRKDKWRLLHDLRQINNVIEDMGSLQPGMPSPTVLPQNWKLAVIDIKDCFFQIPLHPDDAPRFAFSVLTINRVAPRKRYHWRVLPQGMKNSPVICQWFVASLLSPVRAAADKAIIHHYMDDVLVCAPNDDVLSHALDLTITALIAAGFKLQDEKVQRMPPWRYLGLEISRTIVPQNWRSNQNLRFRPHREKSLDAIKHLIQAFSFMGIPRELKTDNGPVYRSREFCSFLQQWGVEHKTGIPHSPTGQAVVERTHKDIKRVLHQQQRVLKTEPPSIRLARALFTINFLNCSFEGLNPPVVRHFGANPQFDKKERPPIMVKDPETGRTEGPHGLVTWVADTLACLPPRDPNGYQQSGFFQLKMNPAGAQFPSPRNFPRLLGVCLTICCLCLPSTGWIIPQPKTNVWATLARSMGQDHICLTAASADDPLSTCLVGIPFKPKEFPSELLQLLRSANQFIYTPPKERDQLYHRIRSSRLMPDHWCKDTVEVDVPTTLRHKPLKLPKGVFLICGDRAWAGIPPLHIGGPCTLGQLSLFTPTKPSVANWQRKISRNSAIQKTDLSAIDPDCDHEIVHWSKPKGVTVTIFLPWVAIAKALGELAHLECWVAKQANLTTDALTNLLGEEENHKTSNSSKSGGHRLSPPVAWPPMRGVRGTLLF